MSSITEFYCEKKFQFIVQKVTVTDKSKTIYTRNGTLNINYGKPLTILTLKDLKSDTIIGKRLTAESTVKTENKHLNNTLIE